MKDYIGKNDVRGGLMAVCPEFIFVVLPILVTIYAYFRADRTAEVWHSPEWAFAAVVFAGQTSMKLLTASRQLNQTKLRVVAVVILVFVMAAVVVLSDILRDELARREVAHWLGFAQLTLCGLSAFAFLFFGTIAHMVSKER